MKNPFKGFKQESKVEVAILQSSPGFSILEKTIELSGERLKLPGKKEEEIYTGMVPHVVEISANILPLPAWYRFTWRKKKFRIRLHHQLIDEPFTRDFYSGQILNQEKKKQVLIERGFVDQEGFLLDSMGNRVNLEEANDGKAFIKVDVSDIDMIKAEYKALKDSELVQKAAEGMSKTGANLERNFWIILGISLVTNVILVFLMSGGVDSLGL